MILNGKKLKYRPFNDPRGKPGTSGQLSIGTDSNRNRYLIKRKPMDVANEYVAHNLAKLIGVPTSPAVLVKDNDSVFVGIAYEKDFKRAKTSFDLQQCVRNRKSLWVSRSFRPCPLRYPAPCIHVIIRICNFQHLIHWIFVHYVHYLF